MFKNFFLQIGVILFSLCFCLGVSAISCEDASKGITQKEKGVSEQPSQIRDFFEKDDSFLTKTLQSIKSTIHNQRYLKKFETVLINKISRVEVLEALRKVGKTSVPILLDLLDKETNDSVKKEILINLVRIGKPVAQAVKGIIKIDSILKMNTPGALALQEMKRTSFKLLIEIIESEKTDDELKLKAVEFLVEIGEGYVATRVMGTLIKDKTVPFHLKKRFIEDIIMNMEYPSPEISMDAVFITQDHSMKKEILRYLLELQAQEYRPVDMEFREEPFSLLVGMGSLIRPILLELHQEFDIDSPVGKAILEILRAIRLKKVLLGRNY